LERVGSGDALFRVVREQGRQQIQQGAALLQMMRCTA
jgi:hypothetical protein